MGIKVGNNDISYFGFNSSEIETATYNNTTFYEKITLVPYTFPNENAKLSSQTGLGISVDHDSANGSSYHAYKAFDNDLTTGFMAFSSNQTKGKISIVFPFDIQVQSIIIQNPSQALGSSGTIGGLKTGAIYIDTTARKENFDDTDATAYEYDNFTRDGASTASYSTEHINEAYATTNIRSICIQGTSWGSSGTSSWHQIGEVYVNFKASPSDLNNWKSTYGIS